MINVTITISDDDVIKSINAEVKAQIKNQVRLYIDDKIRELAEPIISSRITSEHVSNLCTAEVKRRVCQERLVNEPYIRESITRIVLDQIEKKWKSYFETQFNKPLTEIVETEVNRVMANKFKSVK
jgi:hypothetical protein